MLECEMKQCSILAGLEGTLGDRACSMAMVFCLVFVVALRNASWVLGLKSAYTPFCFVFHLLGFSCSTGAESEHMLPSFKHSCSSVSIKKYLVLSVGHKDLK